ncbi:ECF RNA polymerase sigma-E factor [Stieleria neptunia]|uniref:ECF RNA polymerase sigma-E factor n=2 Tax=Stieleria neptunia TaxID=2527979 RepID=A0A518I350_9BACT|nr:ECF RNA polymerase sigma-E factor [Stieleria neptunia]
MFVSEVVIERAIYGESEAQREIYEALYPRVYRLVRRIAGETDADDVSQDAFMQVLSKLDSYGGKSAFATWVHRVAVNQALQHVRSRSRHPAEPLYESSMTGHDTRGPAGLSELLDAAMHRIDVELRLVFQLKEIDGMAYAEIAQTVGIPEGTVASRMNRARRELQLQLIDLGWEP